MNYCLKYGYGDYILICKEFERKKKSKEETLARLENIIRVFLIYLYRPCPQYLTFTSEQVRSAAKAIYRDYRRRYAKMPDATIKKLVFRPLPVA